LLATARLRYITNNSWLFSIRAAARVSSLKREIHVRENLNELQRRIVARQQQHYSQCAVLNGITLVAAILVVGFVSAIVW